MGKQGYIVTWVMGTDAESPMDAAAQAQDTLNERVNWDFEVTDCETGNKTIVNVVDPYLSGQRRPTSDEEDEFMEMDAVNE